MTSVRDVQWMFLSSWSILQMSRSKKVGHKKWTFSFLAEVMQILEWFIVKVKPGLGEKIVTIAKK